MSTWPILLTKALCLQPIASTAHPAFLGALTADIHSYAWRILQTLECIDAAQAIPSIPTF